jgi:APA family basic amino acid/polyamine antiporter
MIALGRRKSIELILGQAGDGERGLKRTLGPIGLTALGVGAIVGTGIFVLTGVAAAKYAGPGLIVSFVIAGVVSALAALCYAELASTVPIAGSAYTYTYATLGEFLAWIIGWDLILEYTVGAAAVSIGWSAYFSDFLKSGLGIEIPKALHASPHAGGIVDLPAMLIVLLITALLIRGTSESNTFNKVVVGIKLAVVAFFIIVGVGHINQANWHPFLPFGVSGVFAGASIIFFAYIGFDMVSTSAEEVRNPKRDLPIGILGSLAICTVLYVIVRADLRRSQLGRSDRVGRGDLRAHDRLARDPVRPEPHLLRDVPRRLAARTVRQDPSGVSDAVPLQSIDGDRRRAARRAHADRGGGRAHQHRNAGGVRARVDRRRDLA